MAVEIHGHDLPGRRCAPRPGGGTTDNIHVGLKRGTEAARLTGVGG
jgi:hypothetical protein